MGKIQKSILEGYTVLDLSSLIAGPYCASLLGDLGAEVIKVELSNGGDGLRHLGRKVKNESILFLAVNRNKKSITLALNSEEGRDILDRLILRADVLIENFRPDVRKRYGLDYERVCEVKPDIVYVSITAFGEDGPYRLKPGTDHVFQGLSGIMSVSGEPDQGPVRVGVPIADLTASLYNSYAVMSALLHREKTGEGQLICVNLLDAAMSLQMTHITEYFLTGQEAVTCGNDSPFAYPVGVFKTINSYIAISAFSDKFWKNFCSALDLEILITDNRFDTGSRRFENRDLLRPLIAEKLCSKNTEMWLKILEQEDVPCGPVHSYDTLFKDPQIENNRLVTRLPHSVLGEVKNVGNPVRFSETPIVEHSAAPVLGEHTDQIFIGLGFSKMEIKELRKKKII
ncbi:MAG: CoA transferase [Nitrospina sp.]|nr:CoA transferase [Nitrospina sp.]